MPTVPLPDMAEEENLPEKERLRRAEARLLPSQPPDVSEPESSTATRNLAPSAPILPDHSVARIVRSASSDPTISGPIHGASAPPTLPAEDDEQHSPAAPEYDGPSEVHTRATDDKQELHRRRLEMERSAPDAAPEQAEENGPSAPPTRGIEDDAADAPSAPAFLDEDDDHGVSHQTFFPLPRYER